MTNERLDDLAEDVRYIRGKVDAVESTVTELRVLVEHRITKLETKATFYGSLGGFVAGLIARLLL